MEETYFDSVQGTTTTVYHEVHRGGVTQKWAKYVSSLRVESGRCLPSLLLVACVALLHCASRAANSDIFHFNHRKSYM